MNAVAVTGASGLIGTALRGVLAARGVPVRALVRSRERACAVGDTETVVVGCVSDPRAVSEACADSGAIVHLARSTHRIADICRFDYPAMYAVLAAANTNAAELHFPSSQAVFGNADGYPPPVLDDGTPPNPCTAYGAMKAAFEWTAKATCRIPPVVYRLPVVVPARLSDGAPWLRHLLAGGFCHLDVARRTVNLMPFDERFQHGGLSFVHVEDVVATIAANLFREPARGTVAMLADPEYLTFRELADVYADAARCLGYTVRTMWAVPGGGPCTVERMFRFDTTTATARLGFTSEAGRARLFGKLTDWFAAAAGAPHPP